MTVNPSQVASSWISQFGKALESEDINATVSSIHSDGYFRDILVFSWNNRCLHGHAKLRKYLTGSFDKVSIRDVKLETRTGLTPEYGALTDKLSLRAVSAGFNFTCAVGVGRGYFSLVFTDSGEWKALVVMMALADIEGHEEIEHELGIYEGHALAWTDVFNERRKAVETNPHVLIIGGGQAGLNVAARFKQMNLAALVVETTPRIGDSWRKRYPTLTLHSPKKSNSMLFQPFPKTWPVFTPRDKLADWLEQYAQSQDLIVWTNSRPLPHPVYDNSTKRWTVMVDRAGERVTLHPFHIVIAASTLGAPRMPVIPRQGGFKGSVLHSSVYQGGKPFTGKKVIVVGAANTAADISQDLVFHGAQSITMVQRSATWILSRDSARIMFDRAFPEDVDIDVCDLMAMARPISLLSKIERQTVEQSLEEQKTTHQGLAEAGFKIMAGKGFLTLWYEGRGGYSVDVGCAELISSGKVKIKHGVELAEFKTDSVLFTDGSSLEADVVIFATSYENIGDTMRKTILGDEIMDRVGPVWGLDDEGELRGCYRPTGQPGLWFAAGEFYISRAYSKQLALEIKAIELGLMVE
ncbi:FAD/NAD-P-binding domain-containing protein [Mycena alexandri]|uniref:FAD/NAD-P-binding domain-containing protein n=1 Tax=Mycena alexandri TaxID=1745969 RepID=A0AAD6XCI5_9AGAR|nr:FAD/NAD-P-binding domain-containing protein [Mycena alexandri]KAJ7043011.1 FAD/NAD-P-binding domain-containing protein [Mycena alexandri]